MKDFPRHIIFIDYLRGIAILGVFLFHCLMGAYGANALPWNWITRDFHASWSFIALLPLHYGFIGVPIFFVVSGFCIHLSFEQQGREWKSFFIRRFFRIYPAYIVAIGIFSYFYTSSRKDFWYQFGFHALLIHNFNPRTFYSLGIVFWTIGIEVQLYLLYPLLRWLVGKWGWKRILIGLAICEILLPIWNVLASEIYTGPGVVPAIALMKVTWFVDHYLKPSPLAYWFSWALGALTADAFLHGRPMPLAKFSTWSLATLVVISYFLSPLWVHFFLFSALLSTKVIGNYLSARGPQARASNFWLKHLQLTGKWSYSIYLLHAPLLLSFLPRVLKLCFPAINPLFAFFCLAGSGVAIFPLAGIWYRIFEKPGIALGKTLIRRMAEKKPVIPAKAFDG